MFDIPTADILSLTWFIVVWVGYTWYADRGPWRKHSLRAVMHTHREEWMRQMVLRDNRVADVNILRNLLQSVSFFASTTLLILAGLMATLGASDRGIAIVRALPFAAGTTLGEWELKLLVMGVIFVHAFFKFTWALRQFNYCSVLIGAAPKSTDGDYARRAAEVSTNASKDFNQGLRAYYFSLAALGWFVHPWVFVAATTLVTAVLYLREHHSMTMKMLLPRGID